MILSSRLSENTLLFVDSKMADVLTITQEFKELFKKPITIASLEGQNERTINDFLLKLLSTLNTIEHVSVAICSPIEKFSEQIDAIANFGEYDLVKILTASPIKGKVPRSISPSIIEEIPQCIFNISPIFKIIPSLPPLIAYQYKLPTNITPQIIAPIIRTIFQPDISRIYSIGHFSQEIESFIQQTKVDKPSEALILIDRCEFSAPLFSSSPSLLDCASSNSIITVLRDEEFIKSELNIRDIFSLSGKQEIFRFVQKKIGAPEDKNNSFEKLYRFWDTLNSLDQRKIAKKNPAIQTLFTSESIRAIQLQTLQQNYLQGAPISDLVLTTDPESAIKLVGFSSFVDTDIRFNPRQILDQIQINNDSSFLPIDDINRIISMSKCQDNSINDIEESYTLPAFLEPIFDNTLDLPSQLSGHSRFLFGRQKETIRDFKKISIFIFGGISFAEMGLINQMCKNNQNIETSVYSDSICSSLNIFKKN